MLFKAQHYFKSAFVNLKRNTGYILLMIFSLTLGMYCFVMGGLYVRYEFSRNLNHEHVDQVYRIMLDYGSYQDYLSKTFVEEIRNSHPEVEAVSTINRKESNVYLSVDRRSYVKEEQVYYSDSSLFDVFTFPLKYGNESTALSGPGKVVISDRLSRMLFFDRNPVGENLIVHEKGNFIVSGVMKEISQSAVFKPELFFTMEQYDIDTKGRDKQFMLTHIRVKPDITTPQEFQTGLYESAKKFFDNDKLKGVFTENLADSYWSNSIGDYGAQFYSLFGNSKKMVYIVLYITIGVLLCSFLGYVAISLSLSFKRAKEVGIRKINGASSKEIRNQFLAESIVYALISLVLTIVGLELSEQSISNLFQVPVGLNSDQPEVIIFLIVFSILTGTIAGCYPSIIVSRFKPMSILSDFSNPKSTGFFLKRILLTSQFVITICLVFGVYVLKLQVSKMSSFDIGYDTEHLIAFGNGNDNKRDGGEVLLSELEEVDGVEKIAKGPFPYNFNGFTKIEIQRGDSLIVDRTSKIFVSENFFDVMNIEIIKGSSFSSTGGIPIDKTCVINKHFADLYGLNNVIGSTINVNRKVRTIVGVVDNYSDWGVGSPDPLPHVFLPANNSKFHSYLLKVNPDKRSEVVSSLISIWRGHESVLEPNIIALDTETNTVVKNISKTSHLFTILAAVVLVLSLMNLLGIAIMFANSKIKTMSIRKILGASTSELFFRFSMPFVKSLALALLVALPIGYYLMEEYLMEYAVRIDLDFYNGMFVSGLMIVLLFFVLSIKLVHVSSVNPSEILRSE